jgi:hypothetical protein
MASIPHMGLEPTTYGLKVPERSDVTPYATEPSSILPRGAQCISWLQRMVDAESRLTAEQQRFILDIVERELGRLH